MNRKEIERKVELLREALAVVKEEVSELEADIGGLENQLEELNGPKHGDVVEWVGSGVASGTGVRRIVVEVDGELMAQDVNGITTAIKFLEYYYKSGDYKVLYNIFSTKLP